MKLTDTQRKLAEQLLLSVMRREPVVEYNELAARIDPPMFQRNVGREIGEVSKLCHKLGLPLLSAKVVTKGKGTAGDGFFTLMSELGIKTKGKTEKEQKQLFSQELKKIRECNEWYKLADYLNLDLDLPRPDKESGGSIDANTSSVNARTSLKETGQITGTSWIIPANSDTYDVIGAFNKFVEIDWRQTVNYTVGDIIYIYCAKPYQRIMYKTKVKRVEIPSNDMFDDREFWIDTNKLKEFQYNRYVRLQLVKAVDTDLLSLERLLEHGLKTAPQGPLRADVQLEAYIDVAFENTASLNNEAFKMPPLPEELDATHGETYTEGAKKQIIVNAYERNSVARNKCIRIHGSKCIICGFDFGAFYGPDLEGKIHIHHIKPLHLIDDTYEVNPEKDLVPVCPNCHMVIHSKRNGTYSVDEVRKMVGDKKMQMESLLK